MAKQNKVFKSSKVMPIVSSAASTGATTQQKPTMFTVQSSQETNNQAFEWLSKM